MGENSRGLSPIQSREVIVQPLKSLRLNHGFLVALPFAGIQADELPAFMPKIIVKPQSKSLSIVSSTTLVWSVGVIVVADDWIDRRAQNGEKFLNCFEVPALTLFGQISSVETEFCILLFHPADYSFQPGAAIGAEIMGVIDNDESERAPRGSGLGTQGARPKPHGQQRSRAQSLNCAATIDFKFCAKHWRKII